MGLKGYKVHCENDAETVTGDWIVVMDEDKGLSDSSDEIASTLTPFIKAIAWEKGEIVSLRVEMVKVIEK